MERPEIEKLVQSSGLALKYGEDVFLCDAQWTPAQREAFEHFRSSGANSPQIDGGAGWLCVPTGGSGGRLRFSRHDERTLGAAVRGFCTHLNVQRVNAVSVLPMHHVSGLMSAVRCRATGGQFIPWSWKQLEAGAVPTIAAGDWFLSLVPTQLQRLLKTQGLVEWLRQFHTVFIGGGPVWPALLDQAGEAKLPLALSYGLTESAAMVTGQHAGDFLRGDRSSGWALPHAQVEIVNETNGRPALAGESGLVRIVGESIHRGYYPSSETDHSFLTADVGCLNASGTLHILGRSDAVIITGGKKVHASEVEAVLRAPGVLPDVAVIGLPDDVWGEMVVACYPLDGDDLLSLPNLDELPAYKRPKRLIPVAEWPRNLQGKIDREALRALVLALPNPRG